MKEARHVCHYEYDFDGKFNFFLKRLDIVNTYLVNVCVIDKNQYSPFYHGGRKFIFYLHASSSTSKF